MIAAKKFRKLIRIIDRMPLGYDFESDFDAICEDLFGATWADVTPDEEDEIRKQIDPVAAYTVKKCRELGYDLIISGNVPVRDWEEFAVMIIANSSGLLPKTPEERAIKQKEVEAQELAREAQERALELEEETADFERGLKVAVAEFTRTRR